MRAVRSVKRGGQLQFSAKLAKNVKALCASAQRVETGIREAPRVQEPDDEEVVIPRVSNAWKRDRPSNDAPRQPLKLRERRAPVVAVAEMQVDDDDDDNDPGSHTEAAPKKTNKGMRVKEGCVARVPGDHGIVLVTAVEDDEVLVLSKDATRKRGIVLAPTMCCVARLLTSILLQSGRTTLTWWSFPLWSLL